jgi:hypothetical protein
MDYRMNLDKLEYMTKVKDYDKQIKYLLISYFPSKTLAVITGMMHKKESAIILSYSKPMITKNIIFKLNPGLKRKNKR